ncbi:hypothetical protein [Escherichia coli]|uniref:hypothetical protein n=1 Tax=Escherichia coli TaxID=562 RepID=UPI003D80AF74
MQYQPDRARTIHTPVPVHVRHAYQNAAIAAGHRASNWAQTLPPEQRPTFTQVASLAETAQQVNAVWKFALTHDDLPQLQHFGKHVEHELGLECE